MEKNKMSDKKEKIDSKNIKDELLEQLLACNNCTQELLVVMFETVLEVNSGDPASMLRDISDFYKYFIKQVADKTSVIYKVLELSINSQQLDEKLNCCVCCEDFNLRENARKLDCSHIYHTDCIRKWFRTKSTCPVCRSSIVPETITGAYFINMLRQWKARSSPLQASSLINIEEKVENASATFYNVSQLSKSLGFLVGIVGSWRGNQHNIALSARASANTFHEQTASRTKISAISKAIDIMLGGTGEGWDENDYSAAGTSSTTYNNEHIYGAPDIRRRNIESISRSMYLLYGSRENASDEHTCNNASTDISSNSSSRNLIYGLYVIDHHVYSLMKSIDLLVSGMEREWAMLNPRNSTFEEPAPPEADSSFSNRAGNALPALVGRLGLDAEPSRMETLSPVESVLNRETDSSNSLIGQGESNYVESNIPGYYRGLGVYTNGRPGIWHNRYRVDVWGPAADRSMTPAGWSAHHCVNIFGRAGGSTSDSPLLADPNIYPLSSSGSLLTSFVRATLDQNVSASSTPHSNEIGQPTPNTSTDNTDMETSPIYSQVISATSEDGGQPISLQESQLLPPQSGGPAETSEPEF